jgi:hypothetical protein
VRRRVPHRPPHADHDTDHAATDDRRPGGDADSHAHPHEAADPEPDQALVPVAEADPTVAAPDVQPVSVPPAAAR